MREAGTNPTRFSGAAPQPDGSSKLCLSCHDGTIALTDVSDTVLAEHVSHADWERIAAIYDAGRMGSRRLMEWEIKLIRATEAELLACKNFGQTSLNEIRQRLAEYGLKLREPS